MKVMFLLPALLFVPPLIFVTAISTANAKSCNPINGRNYCIGYGDGVSQADRDEAVGRITQPYCPNDDPSNPNNAQYCTGFTQGYNDEASQFSIVPRITERTPETNNLIQRHPPSSAQSIITRTFNLNIAGLTFPIRYAITGNGNVPHGIGSSTTEIHSQ
jgi:hypothetical protein